MDDEKFNMSMRKYLKQVGVTSQQAIERHVREHGDTSGRLKVRTVLTVEGHGMEHVVGMVRHRTARVEALGLEAALLEMVAGGDEIVGAAGRAWR